MHVHDIVSNLSKSNFRQISSVCFQVLICQPEQLFPLNKFTSTRMVSKSKQNVIQAYHVPKSIFILANGRPEQMRMNDSRSSAPARGTFTRHSIPGCY